VGLVLCLKGGVNAFIGAMPIEYIRYFGLALMIVGAVLSIVSCVNYSVKAVAAFKDIANKAEREQLKDAE
ncbi:MAG: hypothetical protein IJB98_03720, partial [Clostridia bacterium]|nr:hypothetical protein [Clostridia bacterium]